MDNQLFVRIGDVELFVPVDPDDTSSTVAAKIAKAITENADTPCVARSEGEDILYDCVNMS